MDFVPLTPEEIERVEIEELKHRMQIKEQQRTQKQDLARKSIAQNDFVPTQSKRVTQLHRKSTLIQSPMNAGASPAGMMNRQSTMASLAQMNSGMMSPMSGGPVSPRGAGGVTPMGISGGP